MYTEIEILSEEKAIERVNSITDKKIAVISITSPGKTFVLFESMNPLVIKTLHLSLFDVDDEEDHFAPVEDDFRGIRDFADFLDKYETPENLIVIVHCAYGISRSAAVAAALYLHTKHYKEAYGILRYLYPADKEVGKCIRDLFPESVNEKIFENMDIERGTKRTLLPNPLVFWLALSALKHEL